MLQSWVHVSLYPSINNLYVKETYGIFISLFLCLGKLGSVRNVGGVTG